MSGPRFVLDHLGYTTEDRRPGLDFLTAHLGATVIVDEPPTSVPGRVLGVPLIPSVRLSGSLLDLGGALKLEIHDVPQEVRRAAPMHLGLRVNAGSIEDAIADLPIDWYGSEPNSIDSGPYAGRRWLYGTLRSFGPVIEVFEDGRS